VTNSQGNSNTIVVVTNIVPKPIVASIQGGNRDVRLDRPMVLNGSLSRDPDDPTAGKSCLNSLYKNLEPLFDWLLFLSYRDHWDDVRLVMSSLDIASTVLQRI